MTFCRTFLSFALCLPLLGCPQPAQDPPSPAVDITVRMPYDMVTNLPSDAPLVIEIPNLEPWGSVAEFTREELPSWHDSMRVVRWPSREPIEGRWVFSNALPLSFTFEPTASLPRGWYAIQVNFGTISVPRATAPESVVRRGGAGQSLDGEWTTARFRVGSFAIFVLQGTVDVPRNGLDGGGAFSLGVSEEIEFERDVPTANLLRVSVDGVPLRCAPYAASIPTGRFLGATWMCETPARAGTVRAELMPLIGTSLPARYSGEAGQPVWVGQTGDRLGGLYVDDSLFVEEGL